MEKVVVTGGAGFIGSNLTDQLIKDGFDVHIIDNLSSGKRENVNKNAKLYVVDIRNFEEIKNILNGAKYVFHMAAIASVPHSIKYPLETNDVNLKGLLSVLEASKITGVDKLVFSSSCAVYGDQNKMPISENVSKVPISPYALSKYEGELECQLYSRIYNLKTVCLRYFNVFGPRMNGGVIDVFLRQKKNEEALSVVGDGKQKRDYIYVSDVVCANILSAKSSKVGQGEVINIGSGRNYSVNDIADLISEKRKYENARLEPKESVADIKKAKEFIGFEAKISLKQGLKYLKKYY